MKNKKLYIILGIAFSLLLVFFFSYGITFKNMEVMNADNQMGRIIKEISVLSLSSAKADIDGKTGIEYGLSFRIPSKFEMKDIEKNLGFSLKFKGKGTELLGIEATKISQDFSYQEDDKYYVAKFIVFPLTQKPEDIDSLLSKTNISIEAIVLNKTKVVKSIAIR